MISYNMIISEIQQHVKKAGMTNNDQEKRESLAAIRALCDVALQSKVSPDHKSSQIPQMMKESVMPPQQMTQMVSNSQIQPPINEQKLQESDANGDSLFDF